MTKNAVIAVALILIAVVAYAHLTEARTTKPVEDMSFEEVLEYIENSPSNVGMDVMGALTQRLYKIAYFDNHVPLEHRNGAVKLLESIKATVEDTLKDNLQGLKAYQDAYTTQEEAIPYVGYGSLAWMMKEQDIKDQDVISFVMKPEHAHLLQNFLVVMGDERVVELKSILLKEFVYTRRNKEVNSVNTIHGAVSDGDEAAKALLGPQEFSALLQADVDYHSARDVLVKWGLLPETTNAAPFLPKPANDTLELIIVFSVKDYSEDRQDYWPDYLLEYYNSQTEDEKSVIDVAAMLLRLHLFLRTIGDIYGDEVQEDMRIKVLARLKHAQELGIEDWLNALSASDEENRAENLSRNLKNAYALMLAAGYFQTNEIKDQERDLFVRLAEIIHYDRVYSLEHFRFMLRYFTANYLGKTPTFDEMTEVLVDIYRQYGAFSKAEEYTYFEDWIGFEDAK